MIGFYNYTVILTYASLLSASMGIVVSQGGNNPYIGCLFLLFCGLCDAFDGRVARTKRNRTPTEQSFGIQIDSLTDIVSFGVLPACIGAAMIRTSPFFREHVVNWMGGTMQIVLYAILTLYVLAAMIRLAYFNVIEETGQQTQGGTITYYIGLPVTSAALIFPTVLLIQYILQVDITLVYLCLIVLTGFAFLIKFRMPKLRLKGILVVAIIGFAEFITLVLWHLIYKN